MSLMYFKMYFVTDPLYDSEGKPIYFIYISYY